IAFVKIGFDLMRYQIGAARWALVAFLWMSVGLVVVFIGVMWIQGKGGDVLNDQPFDFFDGLAAAWFYLVPLIIFIPAFRWLGPRQSIIYEGEESLGTRNTRFAWTLLIPTLAVLVVVAARPLEQTFIKSLTDDVFADSRPADFVGLNNYQQLLTFRPVIVDCRIDGRYMVTGVQDGSPAAQAGFADGDVFLSIAGEDVEDAVSERSDLEVRTNEEGVEEQFIVDDLAGNEEITRPFNEAFSELVSGAVDEGGMVEFEVSRPEEDGYGRNDVDLEVDAAVVTDTSPAAFGLSTEFEGGCARAAGGKRAIQWNRTEFEDRRGDERYEQALAYTLPGSSTSGLKIVAKDPEFINSFVNTIRFTLTSVVVELIIGMIIALVVNSNFAGRGIMRAAMLVPWSIPTVVAATLWQVMLRPDNTGIINTFMMDTGMLDRPQQWLTDLGPWMNSIIAVDVWKTSPFMALLILAGLQTIPGDLYEAASVDGANRLRQFFSITVPLLRPTIAVALIFRTLDALRAFDVFQVLLDPTRPSMATYNYSTMVDGQREVGYASAVGVLIFIFILIFTILYVRFVGIESNE
ncbi:MAG: ABC transporter permease subunit, partial [Chloroflexi bacterium]|nr:ABC transporter permease subunit [Chloroflexota bacterium]